MADAPYIRIRNHLAAQIRGGDLRPGDKVPTEAELQAAYGVSRATAQRALRELAQVGLVVRHRRIGSFVAGPTHDNLLRLVDPQIKGPEIPGRHEVERARVSTARECGVDLPDVPEDEPVVELRRLKFDLTDTVIAIEQSAVPLRYAPDLLEKDLVHTTVLDYLGGRGVPLATSRMYISAVNLTAADADLLEAERGAAVLRLSRVTRLADGTVAEAMWHVMKPGLHEFYIEQTVEGLGGGHDTG
ncbi:GntR family transcriptional regulator [Actinoallomurus sp. NBC_01490]|uniref:GntR family transcriptional regulator n=1 Tax=Actinoallomurus sp. NBC_01490 TaxID=2903557 RepID=UPI002E32707D|nr:GntR family transcriptional regulator [Actinoallomurus sp. NBC_01490]